MIHHRVQGRPEDGGMGHAVKPPHPRRAGFLARQASQGAGRLRAVERRATGAYLDEERDEVALPRGVEGGEEHLEPAKGVGTHVAVARPQGRAHRPQARCGIRVEVLRVQIPDTSRGEAGGHEQAQRGEETIHRDHGYP